MNDSLCGNRLIHNINIRATTSAHKGAAETPLTELGISDLRCESYGRSAALLIGPPVSNDLLWGIISSAVSIFELLSHPGTLLGAIGNPVRKSGISDPRCESHQGFGSSSQGNASIEDALLGTPLRPSSSSASMVLLRAQSMTLNDCTHMSALRLQVSQA